MRNNEKIDLSDVGESDSSGGPPPGDTSPSRFQPDTPLLIRWVIKYSGGVIEDEKQADYVLIGFTILITIVSLFLFFNIFKESPRQKEYKSKAGYNQQENLNKLTSLNFSFGYEEIS